MRTVAIIQARMASSRLPGKVLKTLGKVSVLSNVVSRIRRSRLIDEVVVATTVDTSDDQVVQQCAADGVRVVRGSSADVLDRFYRTAQQVNADAIVRITADCPLIDASVSDRTIQAFKDQRPDYASNTLVRTYPRGLDTEVFAFAALERAWRQAREAYQRVHVTPFFYQHPEMFSLLSVSGECDYSRYRWTLDTPQDLAFLQEVYSRFDGRNDFSWQEVIAVLEREPELALINIESRQKELHEG
jgi:spore coat polysaccharide biosynthesis protein SpsF